MSPRLTVGNLKLPHMAGQNASPSAIAGNLLFECPAEAIATIPQVILRLGDPGCTFKYCGRCI